MQSLVERLWLNWAGTGILWIVGLAGEGGIREPAFIRWKGTISGGRTTDELAATYDIFATIVAMAGLQPPAGVTLDGMCARRFHL
jgi:arylsulfatase A